MSADHFEDLAAGNRPIFRMQDLFSRQRNADIPDGIVDLQFAGGLCAVTASAVGGGSHLYTAVTLRAPEETFTPQWSALSRMVMDPYYDRVEAIIRPTRLPHTLPRTAAMQSAASHIGGRCVRLPLAMDWPENASDMAQPPTTSGLRREVATWLQGGRTCRKRTLDRTYLAQAESAGAEIRAMHDVTAIAPLDIDGGYEVRFNRPSNEYGTEAGSLRARRVVLSAGTFGTMKLLFHCRDAIGTLPHLSAALGWRFHTNGDFGAAIIGAAEPDADSGPPVTGWIDCWSDDRLFLMDTGVWPIGSLTALSTSLGRAWSIGVMGFDDNPCRLNWETNGHSPRGRWRFTRDAARSSAFDERRLARLRDLARAVGGRLLAPPAWFDRRMPSTVHPMGGAVIAESPAQGVTNPFGEVFGHPGLYLADASLFPTPTGVAPSMTIAAVAEWVIEHLLAEAGAKA